MSKPGLDVASLVRELRGAIEIGNTVGKPITANLSEPLLVQKIGALCDALEESQREVGRLQGLVEDHRRERKSMGKANAEMADRAENAEADVKRLTAAKDALRVLKDPEQGPPIPFDKVKADLRIKELREEVERLKKEKRRLLLQKMTRDAQDLEREREVKRLREEVKNVTSMIVAIGGAGALRAAREREGRGAGEH